MTLIIASSIGRMPAMVRRGFRLCLCALAVINFAACAREKAAEAPKPAASSTFLPVGTGTTPAADTSAPPTIDSARTMQYIREIVAFGPRPVGSESHKKLEAYITAHLKGDMVEDDTFTADTPEGKFPVRNIIAKFPGTRDGIIVIAGHYDTNYPLRNTGYVGANDGGSSTAILLEFANQLRGKKREGYSVWLVWTDGEEAIRQWTDTDSVYGSAPPGREMAERRHSEEDQGAAPGRHDRRRRP